MTKPTQKSAGTPIEKQALRIFWEASLKHKKELTLAGLHGLGAILLSVGVPFFAGRVLASTISNTGHTTTNLYLLASSAAVGVIFNRIGFIYLLRLQAKVMSDLHERLFARLLQRGSSFHANQISGKLISDAIDFVNAYSTLISTIGITGTPFALIVISGLIIVFFNSLVLGAYLLVVVIITLVWAYFDSLMRHNLRTNRLKATKNLTAHLSDSIVNAQTVKTFAREELELTRNQQLNSTLFNLRIHDWARAGKSGNNRVAALLAMQVGLLVLISRLGAANAQVIATGIFAFTYVFTLTSRLFEINNITRQLEEALLQSSPMTKMLLEDIEVVDRKDASGLVVKEGTVELRNVTFHYKDTDKHNAIFRNLSLSIKPGEKIGLVGPSGGGKSTLTRLLLRFDDVSDGVISIDNQNIAEITQHSLRSNIAYVPQEPLLFHRSIRENIAYGKPQATDEEIKHAAQQAQAHAFIQALPEGYDTIVGERGVKLSGGQRQRIAIARAILKDAPILVLDEATSALDSESEVAIQKALWELMKARTAIVVAHRLSTIQKMDRIIVLKDGAIVESGNHSALLKENGLYAQLWAHQSGGFIDD